MFARICLLLLWLTIYPLQLWTYKIALHAQVYPTKEKVVGSVITTDGLKAAFLRRPDVESCEVFYPGYYRGYSNTTWDFLIIEDPVYPGLSQVLKFNVDGIVTNSFVLYNELLKMGINAEFIMLAADPEVMQRNSSIFREFSTVYVGAGGHMLQQKPELRALLSEAIPFGLRLHGIGWENVPVFSKISRGPLLREDLANAYSSSKLVLASTIKSQEDMFMINNRIFDALSCESVVVAQYSPVLDRYFGGIIQFLPSPSSARELYERLLLHSTNEELEELRKLGRREILRHHTWDHRTIQFMSFMLQTMDKDSTARNPLALLWIESKESVNNLDYQLLKETFLFSSLKSRFSVEFVSEESFLHKYVDSECPAVFLTVNGFHANENNCEFRASIRKYHVIFTVAEPFSELDWVMSRLPKLLLVDDASQIQRRFTYLSGINSNFIEACRQMASCHHFSHYDVILFRNYYDLQMLEELGEGIMSISNCSSHCNRVAYPF